MEPMMPTSFIPKRPVSTEPVSAPRPKSHVVGILSLLAFVAVLAAGVSYVGVRLYQKNVLAQKQKADLQINEARKGIGTEFLADMKRLDARINAAKQTIGSHIVVSPIFAALEQTTLRSVQYKTFSYAFAPDQSTKETVVRVTLTGTAKAYATIALQSDSFTQNTLIKNPVFSNLTIDEKTNDVNFKLTFDVNPASLSYEAFIASLGRQGAVTNI